MKTIFTWYGHATLGVQTGEYRLLIDPFFSGNSQTKQNLEKLYADYILITHGHSDHVGDAQQIARRTGATIIANAEISTWFPNRGLKHTPSTSAAGFITPSVT